MNTTQKKKKYRIVVVDDSEFYNMLLTRQLENYTMGIQLESDMDFSIESYTSAETCMAKIKDDINIAFVDYYLGNGVTGSDVMRKIKQRSRNCKVIILSQTYSIKTALKTITEGAVEFILKDKLALSKCCFLVDDFVKGKLVAHLPR